MGKVISISNQKGGVGKTTTCVNLSTALAALGNKVLLIDMDAQGNATTALNIEKNSQNSSNNQNNYNSEKSDQFNSNNNDNSDAYNFIYNNEIFALPTFIPNLFCIPSSNNLSALDVELSNLENREYMLKNALYKIKNDYDYIFIDCPPSLGMITINTLVASDSILIPVQCEFYSLEGIAQLLETISIVQSDLNKNLKIEGILMTMFDKRNSLSNDVLHDVKNHFAEHLYESVIPRNVKLSEAPSFGKPAIIYDINCAGSKAYLKLAKEFLERQK